MKMACSRKITPHSEKGTGLVMVALDRIQLYTGFGYKWTSCVENTGWRAIWPTSCHKYRTIFYVTELSSRHVVEGKQMVYHLASSKSI